ncbi:hypothetical protein GTNG_3409 [Geobacillus thermodenitrificans NG80-2]|uniref:Uncharacterized protein n=1 Tax=Geobacillus thermodenitrificans (strain NG80-2) TaxID=420246 RepID=A4ITU2_GEOTN|nr:hypothetical protein GTNG_3409 [Geobacillus thermodenitrificans NG80-2]
MASSSRRAANCSDDFIFPSMASAITWASCGIFANSRSPSRCLICSSSSSLARSGVFSSATSMISILAYADRRFVYSCTPAIKYFSFNLPTAAMEICTSNPYLINNLSTTIIHIYTTHIHMLCKNIIFLLHIQPFFHKIGTVVHCYPQVRYQAPVLSHPHIRQWRYQYVLHM